MQGHFAAGQAVTVSSKRYRIMEYVDGKVVLMPLSETGPVLVETPMYMRRFV